MKGLNYAALCWSGNYSQTHLINIHFTSRPNGTPKKKPFAKRTLHFLCDLAVKKESENQALQNDLNKD